MVSGRPKVVFYVSGHGFGHAVRAGEVVRELAARGADVVIRSNASRVAFEPLPPSARLEASEVDVGVAQHDCLVVDEPATLANLEEFWGRLPDRAEAEAERLDALGADVVVCDVAPLGVLAAARLGIPAVVQANFSWDFIYRSWAERYPLAVHFADQIAAIYRTATLLLETPLSGGLDAFPRRRRIGLIVRRATRSRGEVRRLLGIDESKVAILIAFGGFGPPSLAPPVDLDTDKVRCFGLSALDWPDEIYETVDPSVLGHPDLVAGVDLVLGKPGYGTVAECVAEGTPMLWVRREHFAEEPILVRGMIAHTGGTELAPDLMQTGYLREAVTRALATPPESGSLELTGAVEAADEILALVR